MRQNAWEVSRPLQLATQWFRHLSNVPQQQVNPRSWTASVIRMSLTYSSGNCLDEFEWRLYASNFGQLR